MIHATEYIVIAGSMLMPAPAGGQRIQDRRRVGQPYGREHVRLTRQTRRSASEALLRAHCSSSVSGGDGRVIVDVDNWTLKAAMVALAASATLLTCAPAHAVRVSLRACRSSCERDTDSYRSTKQKTVGMTVSELSVAPCANPLAGGTPGTGTFRALCYVVNGKANNPSSEIVFNADVFGIIIDANNDPVLRSGRVGSIPAVPPGESSFALEITVAASQPAPFKLKAWRAEGRTGVVNVSPNPVDVDYGVVP